MKSLFLITGVVVILSCSKGDYICIDCETKSETIQSNTEGEGIFLFYIPNIIITDYPEDHYFGMEISVIDTVQELKDILFPDTISILIFNADEKLIHESNEVIKDPKYNSTLLWNGWDSGIPYQGNFSYKLYFGIDNKIIREIHGEALAVSCEDLENCKLDEIDCDLINCRYFPSTATNDPVNWKC